jgi:hypothetical protein
MNEGALQLWDGVLFRQRSDLTFESISPHVQEWTGLEPHLSLQAIHPADRAKAESNQTLFRLRHARTWQVTWVEQRRRALRDGYEGYWENVTGRIHLSQELAQTHWKATLGAATQRLVHDFNNLLTGVLSLSDAYLLRLKGENPAREGLQLINQNARQAADIVHQIGSLFRDKPGRRSYENLGHLAAGAADMLRRVLPKYSTLKLDCKQETVPVYVDPVDLRQVVVSLGLALTPPINLEVGAEEGRAYLTIGGVASAASAAQLMAQAFAERNEARFKAENDSYTLDFRVTDYTDAERQHLSILLVSDANDEAVRIAEVLRGNGHEAVIGSDELLRLADYRFDAAAALEESGNSFSRSPDVVFRKGMRENEMLAAVSAFFSERL